MQGRLDISKGEILTNWSFPSIPHNQNSIKNGIRDGWMGMGMKISVSTSSKSTTVGIQTKQPYHIFTPLVKFNLERM